MHPDDKFRFQERLRRAFKKHKTYSEQKRLKQLARERRAERASRPLDHEVDAEELDLQSPPRTPRARPFRAERDLPEGAGPLEVATVVAVARTCLRLELGGALLAAPLPLGLELAVGDHVGLERSGEGIRIRARHPRRTTLTRPDPARPSHTLVLAANVDLVVCVVAVREPRWKRGFVERVFVATHLGGARLLLVLNKLDLSTAEERAELERELADFAALGVEALTLSARTGEGLVRLRAILTGQAAVFVGPSGVGKSSLLNAFDPSRARPTQAVRASDGKGRHTTSASELVTLASGGRLIDTPGVRQFGLAGFDARALEACFPDLAPHAARCRYRDCRHLVEPECGVRAALAAGALSRARFQAYSRLAAELEDSTPQ